MSRLQPITLWTAANRTEVWQPTTLDRLGKSEEAFEDVLATTPELLGLQSRRTGIHGPFRVFRQLSLTTPAGRPISPDIVLLAASGHVIVVEVKRAVNPELRDRAVIAQIIDYASSFAALGESDLAVLFRSDTSVSGTWAELIAELFSGVSEPDELAEVLIRRMQGELNLVIACDRVPAGLPEIVAGIASQQALGFDLDLIEVVPYVANSDAGDILFVPTNRLSTEIVARTVVTVTYRHGDPKPSTLVKTTSLDEIEKEVEAARRGSNARSWTPLEVDEAFRDHGDPTALALLEFARTHSVGGQYVSPEKKVNATFGFTIRGRRPDGEPAKVMLFYCTLSFKNIVLRPQTVVNLVSAEVMTELRTRLKQLFGVDINLDLKEPVIKLPALAARLKEFEEIVLWFRDQAAAPRA